MKKIWNDVDQWPAYHHIKEVGYHGGGFTGGDCRKLLKNVDSLEQVFCPIPIIPYVKVLRLLNDVVNCCFSKELCPLYEMKISKFSQAFMELGISTTPKIHILIYHVPQFCKSKGEALGIYSEQASESVHSIFEKFWQRRKVTDFKNPNYSSALYDTIVEFNSFHI